ncbi:MAG: type III pantothenate kinase [Synergistetes bacterium]|nr:type III pantothenate kinase [Synergistota bacterium]
MLLTLDVGNTNIVIGFYKDSELLRAWRLATDRDKTKDEYAILLDSILRMSKIDPTEINGVVGASVVPPLVEPITKVVKEMLAHRILWVSYKLDLGIKLAVDNPTSVGADRIANAVGAFFLYGAPVIVVDMGTALTWCAIDEEGNWLGGAIFPGIKIASEALFSKTALLPKVELRKPMSSIGKTTEENIQSGLIYGYASMIDGMVRRIKREIGEHSFVVATGGLIDLVAEESKEINLVNPWLTLEGLRIIYERNA